MGTSAVGLPEILYLLSGLRWTPVLTALGFAGGIFLGLVVALARVEAPGHALAGQGLDRGVPGNAAPDAALRGLLRPAALRHRRGPVARGRAGAHRHASAFLGRIWRGAIEAVPLGESEAAQALGLNDPSPMRGIVMPQAFRLSLPATIGFLVQLLMCWPLSLWGSRMEGRRTQAAR